VFFTSGVAEAIHLALSACADRQLRVGAVEEIGVLRSCDLLASRGTDVSTIPVDRDGRLSPDALGAADIGSTALVVQDVNIEVGVRQPLDRLRSAVGPDVPIIMDARATLGRDRVAQSWDVLFAEAKLWGGPPGCALVAVREPGGFRPQVPPADGHGGIEPPAPAVALCASAAFALESSSAVQPGTAALSARLRAMVPARIPDSQVVGDPGSDFITMFTFLYVAADELIDRLARAGWSCASGASCTSDTQRPHHVLEQMHASTHGSLRISLPPWSREADLAEFVEDLAGIVAELRREAGAEGL
jgi:cysteine desulfurase